VGDVQQIQPAAVRTVVNDESFAYQNAIDYCHFYASPTEFTYI
jgi:hypothetical protein